MPAVPAADEIAVEQDVATAEQMLTADAGAAAGTVARIRPHLLYVHEYLHHLSARIPAIRGPAARMAAVRRRPWWQ